MKNPTRNHTSFFTYEPCLPESTQRKENKFLKLKTALLCACILFICKGSNAQIHFGIKGGMNLANVSKILGGVDPRVASYAGGKIWIPLGKKMSLEPELIYSGKGYRSRELGADKHSVIRLNYISVPVLFSYLFDVKTRISIGPEIEYLVSAKQKYNSEKWDMKHAFTADFDLGLCTGIDHQLSKSLHAEVRYIHGVTKIYRPYAPPSSTFHYDMMGYNRVFQIGLVYEFNNYTTPYR